MTSASEVDRVLSYMVTEKKRRSSRQNQDIREFILRNLRECPGSIVGVTVSEFGVTRNTVHRYLIRLRDEGFISATGNTKARRYHLRTLARTTFKIEVYRDMPEDQVWRFRILPLLEKLPDNVSGVCRYGFTEMLNNVADHSVSQNCLIGVRRTYADVEILIRDYGIGIFEKIQQDFGLPDARNALFELLKGRLTSDKSRHSGEGIFFTSRMFDRFQISSGSLFYDRNKQHDDEWMIETGDRPAISKGTRIYMRVATNISWTTHEVFEKFVGDRMGFRRTHVPVRLSLYPGDELVSRSQAKRVLARFDDFSEVLLDFDGVPTIGQAFADEIFRVFNLEHPDVLVIAIRTTPRVQMVIDYVIHSSDNQEPELPLE